LIWSAEQHQEERPISLVFGGGSTALRTEHNYLPFGGAQAPSPYAAALFQEQFKNREFIRHCDCSLVLGLVSFELVVGSKVYSKSGRTA
jgi:hypothetical protein